MHSKYALDYIFSGWKGFELKFWDDINEIFCLSFTVIKLFSLPVEAQFCEYS